MCEKNTSAAWLALGCAMNSETNVNKNVEFFRANERVGCGEANVHLSCFGVHRFHNAPYSYCSEA